MRKILSVSFGLFVVYFVVRLATSYTILSVPYMFGTETFVGYAKYDFPICIINPLREKGLKRTILKGLQDDTFHTNVENISSLRNNLNVISDFDIISVNTDDDRYDHYLIQICSSSESRYVIFMEKGSDKVIQIRN